MLKMNSLLCLVCFVAAVTLVNGSCVDKIHELLDKKLVGGWTAVDMDVNSDVEKVAALAQRSATVFNQMSNDMRVYEPTAVKEGEPIVQEAYVQLVNGLNYCLRFAMQSTDCKNTRAKDNLCSEKRMLCDVQVYTDFSWTSAGNGPAPDVSIPLHCVTLPSAEVKTPKGKSPKGENSIN